MNKKTKIIIGLLIAIIVMLFIVKDKPLGLSISSDYWTNATNSSSSVATTATTTSPILSLDASRSNAIICNNGVYPVFLHPKGSATTTGVAINTGIRLAPIGLTTSTIDSCISLPNFRGYLIGIADTATWVTVTSW